MFKLMTSTAVCGILASLPSARFVTNSVIVPRPALSLVLRCRKPGHMARECVRAWHPSSSAVRATVSSDHSMERKEEVIPPPRVVSDAVSLVPLGSTYCCYIVPVRPAIAAVSDVTVTTVPGSADTTRLLSLHQK